MSVTNIILVFLIGIIIDVQAARILAYYPTPSISHQVVFRPITLELLRLGHEVTVVTTDPLFASGNGPNNLTEIDVHEISYQFMREKVAQLFTGKKSDVLNQLKLMRDLNAELVEKQTAVDAFQKILQNTTEKFDLILLEAICFSALGLTHVFDAPTILISSFGAFPGNYEAFGVPTHPLVYHNVFRQRLYNLTWWEKITELYNQIQISYLMNSNNDVENKIMQRVFGDDIPPVSVLRNNVDMLLLNINPIWEGNYPVPPNVIYMGGLHQKLPSELPKDLQNFLDSSKNGVIFFSLGTNVKPSMLPPEKIAIFENVFAKLPYIVLWKWELSHFHNTFTFLDLVGISSLDDMPTKSKNVKIFKWLPQSDLLRHPNVKVFITQGGLQSTDEAITAGVPLIGIPMLVDQWYNVEKYVHHKIGIQLNLETLTEESLGDAIVEIAENQSYRNNIANLRRLMQDQPQTPLERSIWWIEYVLKYNGAKHLRAPAANMSWAEFLELKLVLIVLLILFITLGLTFSILKFVVSHGLRRLIVNKKLKTT